MYMAEAPTSKESQQKPDPGLKRRGPGITPQGESVPLGQTNADYNITKTVTTGEYRVGGHVIRHKGAD